MHKNDWYWKNDDYNSIKKKKWWLFKDYENSGIKFPKFCNLKPKKKKKINEEFVGNRKLD